jgi:hypothetical protein
LEIARIQTETLQKGLNFCFRALLLILFGLYFIFNSRWRRSVSTLRRGWCKGNKGEGAEVVALCAYRIGQGKSESFFGGLQGKSHISSAVFFFLSKGCLGWVSMWSLMFASF